MNRYKIGLNSKINCTSIKIEDSAIIGDNVNIECEELIIGEFCKIMFVSAIFLSYQNCYAIVNCDDGNDVVQYRYIRSDRLCDNLFVLYQLNSARKTMAVSQISGCGLK